MMTRCNVCGEELKRYKRALGKIVFCKRCRGKATSGRNNPNWKNGIKATNSRLRDSDKNLQWRQKVFQRDGYTCVMCGVRGGELHAHHIMPFQHLINSHLFYHGSINYEGLLQYEPLWEVHNGATLCRNCHNKIPKRLKDDEFYMNKTLADIFVSGLKAAGGEYIVARSIEDVIAALRPLKWGGKP